MSNINNDGFWAEFESRKDLESFYGVEVRVVDEIYKLYGKLNVNKIELSINSCKWQRLGEGSWHDCPRQALNIFYFGHNDKAVTAIKKWIEEH